MPLQGGSELALDVRALGRPAVVRVLLPVLLVTPTLYLVGWAMAPAQFRPGHLITKSLNIVRFLTGGNVGLALVLLAVLGAGCLRRRGLFPSAGDAPFFR